MTPDRTPSGAGRSHEPQAYLALVRGTYAARMATAVAAVALLSGRTEIDLEDFAADPAAAVATVIDPLSLGLVIAMLALTALTVALAVGRRLRRDRLPGQRELRIAAMLDVFWCSVGYLATGYSSLPFPPLLVVALGVHGLLLSAGAILFVTLVAGLVFALIHVGGVAFVPSFGSSTQVALFIGVGVLSALVGNRLRAASGVSERLSTALDLFSRHHDEILDRLPVATAVLDRQGGLRVNAEFLALAGQSEPGRAIERLRTELPGLDRALESALSESAGETPRGEGELRAEHDEGSRWVSWMVSGADVPDLDRLGRSALAAAPSFASDALGAEAGQPETVWSVMVLLWDQTDRRRSEELRRRAERFAAVAELSAGLAHEVRNPIAALRSSAEQLQESPHADPDDAQLLDVVVREADRLNHLVSEFLSFARVSRLRVERHDVGRLVREAVESVRAAAPHAHARIDVPDVRMGACIDADLFHRVLSNLVLNGLEHSPPGGQVLVRLRAEEEGWAEVQVHDQGAGVPPGLRERVFQPFFTTRSGGTGLGLAIAARASGLMGGQLSVEGDEGEGSVFRFRFPAPAQPPYAAGDHGSAAEQEISGV